MVHDLRPVRNNNNHHSSPASANPDGLSLTRAASRSIVRTFSLAVSFDRVVGAYDSTRGLSPEVMRQIMDAMQDMLRSCTTVLDVGVGTGRFACPLNESGFRVVGVD